MIMNLGDQLVGFSTLKGLDLDVSTDHDEIDINIYEAPTVQEPVNYHGVCAGVKIGLNADGIVVCIQIRPKEMIE